MNDRPITKFRPGLEPLERRQPLSASPAAASPADIEAARHALPTPPGNSTPEPETAAGVAGGSHVLSSATGSENAEAIKPNHGFLVYRRTNPNRFNDTLIPPFGHVLVQATQPVPGQTYNVLSIVVRNGTAQTFNANSGFFVRLTGQKNYTPILTGGQVWLPGEQIVFYVLTKKYYPIQNQVSGGFQFLLDKAYSVAVPGPSGIFLRLTYNPATFNRTIDGIVAFGQGAEGGAGVKTGMAVTNIYEFVSAKTKRNDFGGLF